MDALRAELVRLYKAEKAAERDEYTGEGAGAGAGAGDESKSSDGAAAWHTFVEAHLLHDL